jgi:phage major head subunit gpT-like protein
MILNRTNLNTLFVAFKAAFAAAFGGAETQWQAVATEVPSNTAENEYGWLGQFPRMREWVGERVVKNVKQHSHVIRNKTFEATVAVPREAIEDDQFGVYTPMMSDLGSSAAEHPDELVFGLLAQGFTTTCYDGQYFFDTDHPVTDADGVEQSVSNFQGGTATAWFLVDDSRAIKPLILQMRRKAAFVAKTQLSDDNVFEKNEFVYGVDGRWNAGFGLWQLAYASKQLLDEANLTAALAAMRSMKGDNGRVLGIKPRLLVVPPSLEYTAKKLVAAATSANGAENVLAGAVKVVVVPWLS